MRKILEIINKFRQCKNSEEKIKLIGYYFAKFRARTARGNAWTGEIKGLLLFFSSGGVIILLIDKYFGLLPSLWILPIIWLAQKVIEYWLGRFDEKKLKFWQIENVFMTKEINPFNQELMRKVDEIREKVLK